MAKRHSVKSVQNSALREDARLRAEFESSQTKDSNGKVVPSQKTIDSFSNLAAKLGIGADNLMSGSSYGFNPVTRIRTLMEWIHRGSWLGGVAIDVVSDDMTRAGVTIMGEMHPADIETIETGAMETGVWNSINDNVKWARLYGGSIAVILINGQKTDTPLRIETVGKNAFKGLLVLDRWMVEPSMGDLITELGPELGLPKFYTVTADAPALPRMKIHHSRVIRLEGVRLPYWQRMMENMWGISVIERIYDRMISFDSATTGAAQLVYKAYLRTMKIEGLRDVVAAGGTALAGLSAYVDNMRRFQSNEGISVIDSKDELETQVYGFSGLSDILLQFGQQLSGALQIPLVRLFGQSPAGLNSTGESDIRNYYDHINQQQVKQLHPGVSKVYRVIAKSKGIELPENFNIKFNPLWQLDDKEKADTASAITDTVLTAVEAGLISHKIALKELRQSSPTTGIWTNITSDIINEADEELPPKPAELGGDISEIDDPKGDGTKKPTITAKKNTDRKKMRDSSIKAVGAMKLHHDLDITIENPKGSIRQGLKEGEFWRAAMPAHYGYMNRVTGADGDQLDIYVGESFESKDVWVIDQIDPETEMFDEHKVMLGHRTEREAISTYNAGYEDGSGPDRMGSVTHMAMEEFKKWTANGNTQDPLDPNIPKNDNILP